MSNQEETSTNESAKKQFIAFLRRVKNPDEQLFLMGDVTLTANQAIKQVEEETGIGWFLLDLYTASLKNDVLRNAKMD
jgi:UDP-2,3-diacylglucosamine pyrophosphatase LpxH